MWTFVVDGAANEKELVASVQDYLATWPAEQLARIPSSCRPRRVADVDAVAEIAYRLSATLTGFAGTPEDKLLLRRMTDFFMHAFARSLMVRSRVEPAARS